MFKNDFGVHFLAYENVVDYRRYRAKQSVWWWIQGLELFCVEAGDITRNLWTLGDELSVIIPGKRRSGIPFGLLYWNNHPAIMSWTVLKYAHVGGATLSVWHIYIIRPD